MEQKRPLSRSHFDSETGDMNAVKSSTSEDLLREKEQWSLASDLGLLGALKDFSSTFFDHSDSVCQKLDNLAYDAHKNFTKVGNVVNELQMLANSQFIESRVYDEEPDDVLSENTAVPEQVQDDRQILLAIKSTVTAGLCIVNERLQHVPNPVSVPDDDSDEEGDLTDQITIALQTNRFVIRPLACLIGSEQFERDSFVGLRVSEDLSPLEDITVAEEVYTDRTVDYDARKSDYEYPEFKPPPKIYDQQQRNTNGNLFSVPAEDEHSDEDDLFDVARDQSDPGQPQQRTNSFAPSAGLFGANSDDEEDHLVGTRQNSKPKPSKRSSVANESENRDDPLGGGSQPGSQEPSNSTLNPQEALMTQIRSRGTLKNSSEREPATVSTKPRSVKESDDHDKPVEVQSPQTNTHSKQNNRELSPNRGSSAVLSDDDALFDTTVAKSNQKPKSSRKSRSNSIFNESDDEIFPTSKPKDQKHDSALSSGFQPPVSQRQVVSKKLNDIFGTVKPQQAKNETPIAKPSRGFFSESSSEDERPVRKSSKAAPNATARKQPIMQLDSSSDENDLFLVKDNPVAKPSVSQKAPSTPLFSAVADLDAQLPPVIAAATKKNVNVPTSQKPRSDELFGARKLANMPLPPTTSKPAKLFDSDSEDDIFDSKAATPQKTNLDDISAKSAIEKQTPAEKETIKSKSASGFMSGNSSDGDDFRKLSIFAPSIPAPSISAPRKLPVTSSDDDDDNLFAKSTDKKDDKKSANTLNTSSSLTSSLQITTASEMSDVVPEFSLPASESVQTLSNDSLKNRPRRVQTNRRRKKVTEEENVTEVPNANSDDLFNNKPASQEPLKIYDQQQRNTTENASSVPAADEHFDEGDLFNVTRDKSDLRQSQQRSNNLAPAKGLFGANSDDEEDFVFGARPISKPKPSQRSSVANGGEDRDDSIFDGSRPGAQGLPKIYDQQLGNTIGNFFSAPVDDDHSDEDDLFDATRDKSGPRQPPQRPKSLAPSKGLFDGNSDDEEDYVFGTRQHSKSKPSQRSSVANGGDRGDPMGSGSKS